ncbi:Flagellar motor switch protein FliG [Buchnera aphidicola (Cinara kochiana kochiana)]|uniref:Flagellar motor switch protein FliG n=1 Tax=Buchnera aphidicola (Cinara kochiana kochiana) TaxID=2518976 RepID=A0A451D573_9GAMM|nr:FliG C-terminal domain-containing protein [Buchnera aphidicola]VFP80966.1 Flagellar motor switch protein FliG [Buchnera aphidicola (Cinara kochiana kochiana)]
MNCLNGIQKSALLLISMDIQQSAAVLKCFNNSEISVFIDAMLLLNDNFVQYIDTVIYEFYDLLKKNKIANFDIKTRISQIIENTVDSDKSYKLLKKSFIKNDFLHNITMLEQLGAENIFFFIQNENLNIISVLLLHINQILSIKILSFFNEKKRLDILKKMVNCKKIHYLGFMELNKIIRHFLYMKQSFSLEAQRINQVVNILSYFKFDDIVQFVSKIKTPHRNILNKIISKNFKFKDIINIDDHSIEFIINNTDLDHLCIVLNHIHDSLKNKFISNMSHEKYKYFKKTNLSNQSVSDNLIYLKKTLLLQNIKNFIRDDKIIIRQV